MISAIKFLRSGDTSPCRNIALEKVLTMRVPEGECVLFLWQNRDTVVIGRNQNAWAECRVRPFLDSGGQIARRLSGGGAVYHDTSNLNFTFAARKGDFDPEKQSSVILRAVRKLGVPAEKTGRNDFEAEGRKFSGSACYEEKGCCCHHGTLMMDVDLERMAEALTPPKAKLLSRGVRSVRSRVVNLKEYCPGICRETLEKALTEAFEEVYGLRAEKLSKDRLDENAVLRETAFLSSEEWLFGRRIPFTAALEGRFPWGGIRIELNVDRGRVKDAVCWSDAMDEQFILALGGARASCPYDGEALAAAVLKAAEGADARTGPSRVGMARDVAGMIREQTDGGRQTSP